MQVHNNHEKSRKYELPKEINEIPMTDSDEMEIYELL